MTFSLIVVNVSFARESITKGMRLKAIAMLKHRHSTHEVSKILGISQSTSWSTICREYVPRVKPSRGG